MAIDFSDLKEKVEQAKSSLEDIENEITSLEDEPESDEEEPCESDEAAPAMDAREIVENIVEEEDVDTIFEEVRPDTWVKLARAAGLVEMLEPLVERALVAKIQEVVKQTVNVSDVRAILGSWSEEELQEAKDFFDHPSYRCALQDSTQFQSDGKNGLKLGLKLLIALYRNRYPRLFAKNTDKSKDILEVLFEAFESMVGNYLEDIEPYVNSAGFEIDDSQVIFCPGGWASGDAKTPTGESMR